MQMNGSNWVKAELGGEEEEETKLTVGGYPANNSSSNHANAAKQILLKQLDLEGTDVGNEAKEEEENSDKKKSKRVRGTKRGRTVCEEENVNPAKSHDNEKLILKSERNTDSDNDEQKDDGEKDGEKEPRKKKRKRKEDGGEKEKKRKRRRSSSREHRSRHRKSSKREEKKRRRKNSSSSTARHSEGEKDGNQQVQDSSAKAPADKEQQSPANETSNPAAGSECIHPRPVAKSELDIGKKEVKEGEVNKSPTSSPTPPRSRRRRASKSKSPDRRRLSPASSPENDRHKRRSSPFRRERSRRSPAPERLEPLPTEPMRIHDGYPFPFKRAPTIRDEEDGQQMTLFFTKAYCFSNHFPCERLVIDGMDFTCTEHYYMYYKARAFGDFEAARSIMRSRNPGEMKRLGERVRGFNQDRWYNVSIQVMMTANLFKYRQNPCLRKELFSTAGSLLVEASQGDCRWGAGAGIDSREVRRKSAWRGLNILGLMLTHIRDCMLREEEESKGVEIRNRISPSTSLVETTARQSDGDAEQREEAKECATTKESSAGCTEEK